MEDWQRKASDINFIVWVVVVTVILIYHAI
jgi:hypothetical protein